MHASQIIIYGAGKVGSLMYPVLQETLDEFNKNIMFYWDIDADNIKKIGGIVDVIYPNFDSPPPPAITILKIPTYKHLSRF